MRCGRMSGPLGGQNVQKLPDVGRGLRTRRVLVFSQLSSRRVGDAAPYLAAYQQAGSHGLRARGVLDGRAGLSPLPAQRQP